MKFKLKVKHLVVFIAVLLDTYLIHTAIIGIEAKNWNFLTIFSIITGVILFIPLALGLAAFLQKNWNNSILG
jgi:hypothetical protein